MPSAKITKSFIDSVPLTETGQVSYCDSDLAGFYLIVGKRAKTFVAQKDIRGRTVRYTIGRYGHFTPQEARQIAKDKLYLMAQGINPNAEKKEERKQIITLDHVLQSYKSTRKNLKDSTLEIYEYQLNKYLADWMNRLITDIDKDMIVAKHTYIGREHGPHVANGVMRILRALCNYAHATYDICEVNPVSYLSKIKAWYPEKRRRTYIKPHQLKDWWTGVHELENDTMRDYLIFLLFTGLRRTEAAKLKWEDIDFEDRTFTIHQTKNGDPLVLPMSDYIYEMLCNRHNRHTGEYVFPGPGREGFLAEPKKAIYKVAVSSCVSFTCHDLRRTFITIAEGLDLPYYALKRLMNHRINDVTSGYIVMDVNRLREPTQKIADYIIKEVK